MRQTIYEIVLGQSGIMEQMLLMPYQKHIQPASWAMVVRFG
jgi:hypothetical protein